MNQIFGVASSAVTAATAAACATGQAASSTYSRLVSSSKCNCSTSGLQRSNSLRRLNKQSQNQQTPHPPQQAAATAALPLPPQTPSSAATMGSRLWKLSSPARSRLSEQRVGGIRMESSMPQSFANSSRQSSSASTAFSSNSNAVPVATEMTAVTSTSRLSRTLQDAWVGDLLLTTIASISIATAVMYNSRTNEEEESVVYDSDDSLPTSLPSWKYIPFPMLEGFLTETSSPPPRTPSDNKLWFRFHNNNSKAPHDVEGNTAWFSATATSSSSAFFLPSHPRSSIRYSDASVMQVDTPPANKPVVDEASTVAPLREIPFHLSVRAIRNQRVTMEDAYSIARGGRFAAVFDGHGGSEVSSYLRENLFHYMTAHLKRRHWEGRDYSYEDDGASANSDRTPSVASYVAAIRAAFQQVEAEVLQRNRMTFQGSTAVAVVMHESIVQHQPEETKTDGTERPRVQRTLVSANLGDSRAILARDRKAIDLTRDHKPNEEREKARIMSMGETIEWDSMSKVHRVRNLSLSRAIGDKFAKPAVSSEVEIKLFPVSEEKDSFFLLASDGLWDVMTSQEVVDYVYARFANELAKEELSTFEDRENYKFVLRKNMARSLAREAVRRGSSDNVCILLVWLKDDDLTT